MTSQTKPGPSGLGSSSPPTRHPAEEWPKIFSHLAKVEFCLICLIAVFVGALTMFLVFWVVFGCGEQIHARIVHTIKGMNEAWKICLLILVPLFFRPIFKFLYYLREGPLGTKTELPSTSSSKGEYKSS